MIKLHIDALNFLDHHRKYNFFSALSQMQKKQKWILFEDRKFCDIGNTVKNQSDVLLKNLTRHFDDVCLTVMPNFKIQNMISTFENIVREFFVVNFDVSILLVAQTSTESSFQKIDTQEFKNISNKILGGFICQNRNFISKEEQDNFLFFTPGVHLDKKTDSLGQQYRTIKDAIIKDECDFIIIGRGITESDIISETAKKYQESAWNFLKQKNKF